MTTVLLKRNLDAIRKLCTIAGDNHDVFDIYESDTRVAQLVMYTDYDEESDVNADDEYSYVYRFRKINIDSVVANTETQIQILAALANNLDAGNDIMIDVLTVTL